ncbi:MAG: pyridoxal-phosphate-dependent aminotransferase family protein [Candidatus Bathyarchaeia archaeon]
MTRKPLLMLPGPTSVPERIMKAMSQPIISHRGTEFRELYGELLEGLKYPFQTKSDVFPLTCSGSGGVECIVSNAVSREDHVIVPTYGVFSERMREEVVRCGGIPIDLPVKWGEACTAEQVKESLDNHPRTCAVAMVYNETSTGVTARELPQIGRLCRERDILLLVDAVSALAGDTLKVDDWGIDLCVTGSQKCLAMPPGLSLVSVNSNAYSAIEKNRHKSFYFDLISQRDYARRQETPNTPALNLLYALKEAIAMLREEGLVKRIRRHKICANALYTAFENLGLQCFAEKRFRSQTVLAINGPVGISEEKFREKLKKKHGVAVASGMGKLHGKAFRVGCMGIISGRDVLRTIQAVAKSLADMRGLSSQKQTYAIDSAKVILARLNPA